MTEANTDKLKLMVVDDESDNLDLLYRTFRRDFEVYKAESGFKALEILEQAGEMGIIISDQRMPKMSGTEFLSRTVERFPDTIRILLTAYTDVEDLVGAINAGKVFKYITKPWNPTELKTIVQQAAETYRVLKRRTEELRRSLRRESLFNKVTTAIRESLDYSSMLQKIVETIGQAFAADPCILRPTELVSGATAQYQFSSELFTYSTMAGLETNAYAGDLNDFESFCLDQAAECPTSRMIQVQEADHPHTKLIIPLTYQQELLAIVILYRQGETVSWSDEEIRLIEGVAEQAALAISQARLYQRIQEQSQQMQTELAVARQIQTNLLRQTLPELGNVRVQALCYPAREVGGDFFEVFAHPQGDIWLAVGDVSGKGVPAALFMASAISLLRRELSQEVSPEPDLVMSNLNQSLSEDLVGSNCFITMVIARYSPETQELVYANAGHIYPLVWSHRQVIEQAAHPETLQMLEPVYLKVRGVPLGILPIWKAAAGRLQLHSGDIFLLTSDGITEATMPHSPTETRPSSHSMLQQTGLWQLLLQQQNELDLNKLLAHIQAHNPIQEDDQTILSLEVL
jgi:serine phosphatase RsbU (regulator of sigma subunit)/FixJ family two-component response regulator